ncbi:MAG: ABC transporter substrate-binding protein [Lactobacillales bacterium]|jgi:branched-chain amino acid transport system substrate-binding protein|nr:ABC transporter substrate-binding protein [Lactobacillales bacterium]
MKKIIIGIVVFTFVAVFSGRVWYLSHPKEEQNVIKIGAILPLTGNMSYLGEGYRKCILMAVDKMNSDKNNRYRYELIVEDGGTDVKKAISIYNKMKSIDKIDAIMTTISGQALALKEFTAKDKILQIATIANYSVSDLKYNFVNFVSMDDLTHELVSAFKKSKIEKVSLVFSNTADSIAIQNKLEAALTNNNIKILSTLFLNADEKNVNMAALKIKEENPDLLFTRMYEPVQSIFGLELRRINFKKPVSTFAMFSFAQDKGIFEGERFLEFSLGQEEFQNKYRQLYNEELQSSVSMSYDDIILIMNLIEKYGRPSEQSDIYKNLKDVIEHSQGKNGLLQMDAEGIISYPLVWKKIENGKVVDIEE